MKSTQSKKTLIISSIVILVVGVLCFFVYRGYSIIRKENTALHTEISTLDASLEITLTELTSLTNAHADLEDSVAIQNRKNELLEEYVSQITNTVANFEKLSKLDPELLKKYSKVYFLNENYAPVHLATIDSRYVYEDGRSLEIHEKVLPYLAQMFEDAEHAGLSLRALSAYRSFKTQASLKAQYTVTYGSGANKFSADQGYSEHQLGTTLDFTTVKNKAVLSQFESSPEYQWMKENAYKYGFILSYPKNNAYYIYEPWHWRFVGVSLATKLHRDDKNFYDLEQRVIDEYLLTIFD